MAPHRTDPEPTMQATVDSDYEDVDPEDDVPLKDKEPLQENAHPARSATMMDRPADRGPKPSGGTASTPPVQNATTKDTPSRKRHPSNGGAAPIPPLSSSAKPQVNTSSVNLKGRKCSAKECDKVERKFGDFTTCRRCKMAPYCHRDCRKSDHKVHKKECAELDKQLQTFERNMAKARSQALKGLSSLCSEEGKKLLITELIQKHTNRQMMEWWIDTFRLFRLDDCKARNIPIRNLGVPNLELAFKDFLDNLQQRDEVWATWLRKANGRKYCERLANHMSGWCNIHQHIPEAKIKDHYGDGSDLLVLRTLAKIAYGTA
ncbi:hypothetical protein IFR05_009609 [Cadophora sp. M221]|nr:hypothetical protein IFR05_009609 [Cadophora sp. M221]